LLQVFKDLLALQKRISLRDKFLTLLLALRLFS
jgi:hypothetical protein